jgi:hypothetical protein
MLWVPDRESYRSQIPKFLTLRGRFSWICGADHRPCSSAGDSLLDISNLTCRGHLGTHDVDSDNLTVGLLDLLQLPQKVPEPRLGDDLVGGKDPHPVELGGGLGLGREGSAEDRVFGESGHFSAGTQSERIRGGQLGVVVVTGLEKGQVDERASERAASVNPGKRPRCVFRYPPRSQTFLKFVGS